MTSFDMDANINAILLEETNGNKFLSNISYLWLKISMNNALEVAKCNNIQYLYHHSPCIFFCIFPTPAEETYFPNYKHYFPNFTTSYFIKSNQNLTGSIQIHKAQSIPCKYPVQELPSFAQPEKSKQNQVN